MNSFVCFLSFCLVDGIRAKEKALPLADKRREKRDVYWPLLGTIVSHSRPWQIQRDTLMFQENVWNLAQCVTITCLQRK